MDPITLTILARSIGMLLLIAGGIAALRWGYRLFESGKSDKQAKMIVQMQSFKVSAHSVGPVVMATAVAWGWLGYRVSPVLETSANSTKVTSFVAATKELLAGAVVAPVIETSVRARPRTPLSELVSLWRQDDVQLRTALVQGFDQCYSIPGCASLSGKPARLDARTLEFTILPSGDVQLTGVVRSDSASALVSYAQEVVNGRVTLQPVNAESKAPNLRLR